MGHPVLRQKARALKKLELKSPGTQRFIDDMIDTMREYSGVGLAAPQVHQSLRIFVAHLDSDGRGAGEPIAIVNPQIEVVGSDTISGWRMARDTVTGETPARRATSDKVARCLVVN